MKLYTHIAPPSLQVNTPTPNLNISLMVNFAPHQAYVLNSLCVDFGFGFSPSLRKCQFHRNKTVGWGVCSLLRRWLTQEILVEIVKAKALRAGGKEDFGMSLQVPNMACTLPA